MDPDLILYEAGEVLANLEERTLAGLLLPFNEVGRTNVGSFQVEAGAITIPADPSVITLNLDHERSNPIGRATKLEQRAEGIFAVFHVANTPEGDAALTGTRRKLSAEFHATIKAGKAIAGKLWGSALVDEGAFPSAAVLASDTPNPQTPEATPAEDTEETTEQEKPVDEETTEVQAGADTPATTPGGAPAGRTTPRAVELSTIYASIAAVKANPYDTDAVAVLAALADIKISGAGALPGANILRENWVGQLDQGIAYTREYLPLGATGTQITAAGKRGFRVHRTNNPAPASPTKLLPPAPQATWAGNKTEIGTYSGFTETATSQLSRFALGHDIAREFFDLPGGTEVVEAFLKLVVEDYLVWSDEIALADWIAAAGAPIAPKASYPTDYPAALGKLIQGILAVKAKKSDKRRDVPTFAIANEAAYEELIYAAGGDQHLPAFVNIAVSTAGGGTVDGNVTIVQGDIGIEDTSAVLVGSKKAIEFDELAGGPLHVNALDLARGGVDRAVHGYLQRFTVRPEAVVLVGTPDAVGE